MGVAGARPLNGFTPAAVVRGLDLGPYFRGRTTRRDSCVVHSRGDRDEGLHHRQSGIRPPARQ
jgi:hypothetical protein